MPTKKIRLSAVESKRSRSYLNQLRAEGLDIGIEGEPSSVLDEACPLEITHGKGLGMVQDFPPCNTLYVLPLRVVSLERTVVEDCYIKSAWDDQTIEFPYLVERDGRYQLGPVNLLT